MKVDTCYILGNGYLIASMLSEKRELLLLLLGIGYLVLGIAKESWSLRNEEEAE